MGKAKVQYYLGTTGLGCSITTIDTRFDTPSNGTNSHPELNRAITPREAARIQSFDDNFVFYGSKFYIRSQIGNAVPPLMAEAIANEIWENYYEEE